MCFAFVMVKIDIALRVLEPVAIIADSTPHQKLFYEKQDKANLTCLYAIKRIVFEHLLSGLTEIEDAKALYDVVGERYHKSSKSKVGNLMSELTSMRYDSSRDVRDFIMKNIHIQTKLISHKITLSDNFIVHHALNALPIKFTQIKTAYNVVNEVGSINEIGRAHV